MRQPTFIDDWPTDYSKAITGVATVAELRAAIEPFRAAAGDACAVAEKMSDADMPAFLSGMAKERRGVFAGEEFMERYGEILLPGDMLRASAIAARFGAPWGAAFIRMKEHQSKPPSSSDGEGQKS